MAHDEKHNKHEEVAAKVQETPVAPAPGEAQAEPAAISDGQDFLKQLTERAAAVGAETALKTLAREKEKQRKMAVDRRLHNTVLLLKNYRVLKAHSESAVYADSMEEEYNALDLLNMMQQRDNNTVFVDSIRKSAHRTMIMMEHIDAMLELYEIQCRRSRKPEDYRRWQVIHWRYLADESKTMIEIANALNIDKRTAYKDNDAAVERITALLFGVDGLKVS